MLRLQIFFSILKTFHLVGELNVTILLWVVSYSSLILLNIAVARTATPGSCSSHPVALPGRWHPSIWLQAPSMSWGSRPGPSPGISPRTYPASCLQVPGPQSSHHLAPHLPSSKPARNPVTLLWLTSQIHTDQVLKIHPPLNPHNSIPPAYCFGSRTTHPTLMHGLLMDLWACPQFILHTKTRMAPRHTSGDVIFLLKVLQSLSHNLQDQAQTP